MKDQKPQSPLKRISLIFLTITALGVTSSWLSSCSETTAATTGDHANIERRLTSIEAKLDNQGSDVSNMIALVSKLSDDIGLMADKIVETEKLIVQVITNQTTEANKTIALLTTQDGKTELFPGYANAPMPYVLDQILQGHSGSNGALVQIVAGGIPTATTAPTFNIAGTSAAVFPSPYVLLMSTNGIFGGATSTSVTIDPNKTVDIGWAEMTTILGLAANAKAFFAVKTVAGGQLSAISNTLNVTLQ